VELPSILDGQHTVIADDYSFMKPYYERVLALQKDGIIQSYAALKTSSTHYSGPFYNQQIATLPMGSWFIGTQIAKVKAGESQAVNWGIVKFPHLEGVAAGTTAATITALAVAANSKQQDAALDFVKFVSGPEGAQVVAKTGTFPALTSPEIADIIAATPGFPTDPASKEALITGQRYLEMPVDPKAPQIEVVLNRAHDEIMTENISVDDGLAEMTKGVAEIR
jgi:multiple sugar transport system substrate-binding protein